MRLKSEQAQARFPEDINREHKEKGGRGKCRHALDLAVPEVMLGVGGFARRTHREIGDDGGEQVDQRMPGLRQHRERARCQADGAFRERHPGRDRDGGERHTLFDGLHESASGRFSQGGLVRTRAAVERSL
jgi:hypothetical protein